MKKLLSLFLSGAFLLSFSGAVTAQGMRESANFAEDREAVAEEVSSFDLFWPIVAGRTRGDSLYFLKPLKERLRELLIFNDFQKAEYSITMAEKRAVELEKLVNERDLGNAQSTLEDAQARWEQAGDRIKQLSESGERVVDLQNRYLDSLEKQRRLFVFLRSDVEGEVRSLLESAVDLIDDILSNE